MTSLHRKLTMWIRVGCVLIAAPFSVADAQIPGMPGSRPVMFSGEMGTYGEWYSIRGQTKRRPPATGRLFLRPTLTLYDALSLNFDILLSTEGSGARQNINQFGLHPTWSWGKAHVGDFSDTYSDYTFSGILVRGGAVSINPGLFRFSALGGFAKRAVPGGATDGAFDRYLYGGKLGIGSEAGGYVDLMFLRVRDKISSLPPPPTGQTPIDTLNPAANPLRAYEVTPQENLIGGLLTNLRFLDNRLQWKTEASVSLFTRDMRVDADTTIRLPSFVKDLYRANVTSNVDVAVTSELLIDVDNVSVRGGYKWIGPGYNSLGVASLFNDQQEFLLAPSFRIADWSVSLTYTRQNDNLLHQKLFTIVRNLYAANITFRPAPIWTSNILANYVVMSNDATNDTMRIAFSNLMFGTNQILAFAPGSVVQMLSFSYIFQHAGDDVPLRSGSRNTVHSTTLSASIPLSTSFTLTPAVSFLFYTVGALRSQTTQTYSLAASHRALENRLTTTLASAASFVRSSTTFRNNLSSVYQIGPMTSIGISAGMTTFRSGVFLTREFDEFIGTLNVTQRF
ncbi:MAG TPA: hypothetical protein VNL69_02495 [Bacteroidota bacterium]|nr:hypothetical protein [Bacteroidota bacterium]